MRWWVIILVLVVLVVLAVGMAVRLVGVLGPDIAPKPLSWDPASHEIMAVPSGVGLSS